MYGSELIFVPTKTKPPIAKPDIMDNDFSLPLQSAEIFEKLSKGQFISRNTPVGPAQDLYGLLKSHATEYTAYFRVIGFELEHGKDYYYLTKSETKSQTEDKIEKLYRYIDGLEVLFTLNPDLQIGKTFTPQDYQETLQTDLSIKKKLLTMAVKGSFEEPIERLKAFCKLLEKDSFFFLQSEIPEEYLVLDSFQYLIDIIILLDQQR